MERRGGFTLIETLLGMAFFGVLMALVMQNLRFHKLANDLVEKLDVLQRLRIAEIKLRAELETATAVLHPAPGDAASVPGLVFAGPVDELRVLYLDPQGNLKIKTDGQQPETLASGIVALAIRQPIKGQVECLLKADSKERGKISFVIAAAIGNGFQGEGRPP